MKVARRALAHRTSGFTESVIREMSRVAAADGATVDAATVGAPPGYRAIVTAPGSVPL